MYVCICKAATDSQIENAIKAGACSRRDLNRSCPGIGSVCGKCRNDLQQILNKNLPQHAIKKAA